MRTKVKLTLVGAIAAGLVAAVGFGSWFSTNRQPVSADLKEGVTLQSYYLVGDRFVVPDGTLIIGGSEYAAEASVRTPDGIVHRASEVVLNVAGKYTLVYSCTVNGKLYVEEVEFLVKKDTFSFEGNSSTYTYDPATGITLAMSEGDVFHYNVPVDLSDATRNDELFSAYVTSSTLDGRDFSEYYVVMTDVYDSSNQVYIRVKSERGYDEYKRGSRPEFAYCMTQSYVATEFSHGDMWINVENDGSYRTSDVFGVPVLSSFSNDSYRRDQRNDNEGPDSAFTNLENQSDDWVSIRYDTASKSLYVSDNQGLAKTPKLIANLTESSAFSKDFKGFTEDKCYISVYVGGVTSTANMTIKNIKGLGTHTGVIEDTTPPEIVVNYGDYTESTLPQGIVNKPYAVFDAYAMDLNVSDATVGCKVFYNYAASNKEMIPVINGAFTPKKSGVYTLVYTATDDYGNTSSKVIDVLVGETAEELALTAVNATAVAGKPAQIAAPTLISNDENLGELYLQVNAVKAGKVNDVLYQGRLSDYQPTDYIYMASGEWKISYTLSDYCRSVTYEATVEVDNSATVIFDDFNDLIIDRYFVSGNSYTLPVVNVASFNGDGAIYTPAKIKVLYGEGEEVAVQNNVFTPDATVMGSELEIVYYDANDETVNIRGARTLINLGNNGSFDIAKLFLVDGATVEKGASSISFTASRDASVKVINKQQVEEFSLNMELSADQANGKQLGKFNLILTDSEDASVSLKLTVEKLAEPKEINIGQNADGTYVSALHYTQFYFNDNVKSVVYSRKDFGLEANSFEFSYRDKSRKMYVGDKSLVATTCVNGQPFNGFPSKTVYIEMQLLGVVGEVEMETFNLNKQPTSNSAYDIGKPIAMVNGSYESGYAIGTTLQTKTAYGIDVLTGECGATITVKTLTGKILKTVDGTPVNKLDASRSYDVVLGAYDDYLIQYQAKDRYENLSPMKNFEFSVEDTTKPTLEIVGETQALVTVGTAFVMPQVNVSDDYSQNLSAFAVIRDPFEHYVYVEEDGFTFEEAGSYKVVIGVFDENGNMASVEYFVEVVENA